MSDYSLEEIETALADVPPPADEDAPGFLMPDAMPVGERHVTLFKLLRSQRARKLSLDAALAACHVENERAPSPLDRAELDAYLRRSWTEPDRAEFDGTADRFVQIEREKRRAKRIVDAEEQPTRPPIEVLSIAQLAKRPAPSYLIDGLVPASSLLTVIGAPGSLKTFFCLLIGLCVAGGKADCLGFAVTSHGTVIYVAAEGSGAFFYRVLACCTELGIDPETVPFYVIAEVVNLRDETMQRQIRALVQDKKPVLIIFDTLSRCAPGADENSAADMGDAVNFCTRLQLESGVTVGIVHHPAKAAPSGPGRGSGVIFGAVDTEVRLSSADDEDDPPADGTRTITVSIAKQKDDVCPAPFDVSGVVVPVVGLHGHELAHASGRPITSLVLRRSDPNVVAAAHYTKLTTKERAIDLRLLAVLRDHQITNQEEMRTFAALGQTAVTEARGRILRAGWAVAGKRGAPYVVTDAGHEELRTNEPEF